VINEVCSKLDTVHNLCTVHDTSDQPHTCSEFDANGCWYQANFTGPTRDVIRLDLKRFEEMIGLIQFDEGDEVVRWPGWKRVKARLDGEAPAAPAASPVREDLP